MCRGRFPLCSVSAIVRKRTAGYPYRTGSVSTRGREHLLITELEKIAKLVKITIFKLLQGPFVLRDQDYEVVLNSCKLAKNECKFVVK